MLKPLIIPVFIPHAGCPYRCVFCNQHAIAAVKSPIDPIGGVRISMEQYQPGGRKGERPVQLAFFGGNFLGLEPSTITRLLDAAMEYVSSGRVDGIRFSTRPDTITPQSLSLLSGYPVQTVEIGVQSMDDGVLRMSRRSHLSSDTQTAVRRLKRTPYRIILQMMVGLPGDTDAITFKTANLLAEFDPDGVRIYPTVVLRDSVLANWHAAGEYRPLSLEAAVSRAKSAMAVFRSRNIPVIRLGLQATEELNYGAYLLAGPYHPAFGHLVYAAAFRECALAELAMAGVGFKTEVLIRVHPKDISRLRGERNENLKSFTQRYGLPYLTVKSDPTMDREWLAVNHRPPAWIWGLQTALSDRTPT